MDNQPNRRRHPLLKLRGTDPVMLEVQAQEMLRRPLAQLEPQNVLDLVALHEHPDAPKSIAGALALQVTRMGGEINDIPNGKPWTEFLDEFDRFDGTQVPTTFRTWMKRESERGDARKPERIHSLLAKWEAAEPELFELGKGVTRIHTTVHETPAAKPRSAPRERGPAAERAPAAPRVKAVSSEDTEKAQWITDVVLERIAGATESGLAEGVLIAGVKHRAKEIYPKLLPVEITTVLRHLKEANRLRYSAGRYIPLRRY